MKQASAFVTATLVSFLCLACGSDASDDEATSPPAGSTMAGAAGQGASGKGGGPGAAGNSAAGSAGALSGKGGAGGGPSGQGGSAGGAGTAGEGGSANGGSANGGAAGTVSAGSGGASGDPTGNGGAGGEAAGNGGSAGEAGGMSGIAGEGGMGGMGGEGGSTSAAGAAGEGGAGGGAGMAGEGGAAGGAGEGGAGGGAGMAGGGAGGGPVACSTGVDCPASAPVCQAGVCSACTTNTECGDHAAVTGGSEGVCQAGSCVACAADIQCGANAFCDDGLCVDNGQVVYVDANNCDPAQQVGTSDKPYCSISNTFLPRYIILLSSIAEDLTFSNITTIESGFPQYAPMSGTLTVEGPYARLSLKRIRRLEATPLLCGAGGRLMVDDSYLSTKNKLGTIVQAAPGCGHLTIKRSTLAWGDLAVDTAAPTLIASSSIVNCVTGVAFKAGASGKITYSSLTYNAGAAVYCEAPALVRDSIVHGNLDAGAFTNIVGNCTAERVIVDAADPLGLAGLIKADVITEYGSPQVTAPVGLRLKADDPATVAACVDKGVYDPDAPTDQWQTPRPLGVAPDIGAHELQ